MNNMNFILYFAMMIYMFRPNVVSSSFIKRCNISMKRETSKKLYGLPYKPKKENQQSYVSYLNAKQNKLIFAIGPAGTGKTLFACNRAIQELKDGTVDKIIVTRPIVPVEEDLGFLPGNINKKMDPWVRPIYDLFLESFSQKELEAMVHTGVIEISPLAYMRGRTFKNSFIIADEMQNSSPNQMLMLITRIGVGSRMVITGDLKQSDKGIYSGLSDFIERYRYCTMNKQDINVDFIKVIEFNIQDVERSEVVQGVLNIYESFDNRAKGKLLNINVPPSSPTISTSKAIFIENDAAMIPFEKKNE